MNTDTHRKQPDRLKRKDLEKLFLLVAHPFVLFFAIACMLLLRQMPGDDSIAISALASFFIAIPFMFAALIPYAIILASLFAYFDEGSFQPSFMFWLKSFFKQNALRSSQQSIDLDSIHVKTYNHLQEDMDAIGDRNRSTSDYYMFYRPRD